MADLLTDEESNWIWNDEFEPTMHKETGRMNMYGIYMKKDGKAVLLIDGAFMSEESCFGERWHKPRLFHSPEGARCFLFKSGRNRKHYHIRKYTGADPRAI